MDFRKFYYQKFLSIEDRYVPITLIDDVMVVNFDSMFDRDYTLRGKDELLFQIHKLGQNKKFLFVFDDGTNPHLSGAVEIIKNTIQVFGLSSDTCAVFCREDLAIENITVINQSSIDYWCQTLYPTIKDILIPTGTFNKKFSIWFHRGTTYRANIAQYLSTHFKDDSFISYQETGIVCDSKFNQYFQEEINWAKTNTPIVYDQLFPNRVYTHEMIVGSGRKPYNDYFMEIVVETDVNTNMWLTEKTVKNLWIGKPFLVMSGADSLTRLHELGFKTFSPYFDESYDTIKNNYIRLEKIKQEIDRISQLDLVELHQNLLPILEHNRQNFLIRCMQKVWQKKLPNCLNSINT